MARRRLPGFSGSGLEGSETRPAFADAIASFVKVLVVGLGLTASALPSVLVTETTREGERVAFSNCEYRDGFGRCLRGDDLRRCVE